MSGLLGKKIGMTSIYDETGRNIPVTVIQAGPCVVTQVRTKEKDGYDAIQLAYDDIPERKANKPLLGHFKKAGTTPTRHELGKAAGTASHLCPLARTKLNIVNNGSEGNFTQIECVSDFGSYSLAAHDGLSYLEAVGSNYVTLFPIAVFNQSDTGRTVRVVFNGFNNSRNIFLIAFEIDDSVTSFMSTTNITHGHLPLVVAATGLFKWGKQRLLRSSSGDIVESAYDFKALTGRRGFKFL